MNDLIGENFILCIFKFLLFLGFLNNSVLYCLLVLFGFFFNGMDVVSMIFVEFVIVGLFLLVDDIFGILEIGLIVVVFLVLFLLFWILLVIVVIF